MFKLRRTMMYVPGNNPSMVKDAHIFGADTVMFDLEDSVALNEKDAARLLVYNALKRLDYEGTEIAVRINGLDTPYGREDLEAIVRVRPHIIRLPKAETSKDVRDIEAIIEEIEAKEGIPVGSIQLMAAVESARGVLNAREIAAASKRLVGIAIGAEDFVTDMQTTRSLDGMELLAARSQVLLAARNAGIYALDTVFSDVNNEEGFINEVKHIKQLGFDGKSVINPRQIDVVHRIYTPTPQEIHRSERILKASEEAARKGSGVVSLDGKMVDKPIIERAQRVLSLATAAGTYELEGGEAIAY